MQEAKKAHQEQLGVQFLALGPDYEPCDPLLYVHREDFKRYESDVVSSTPPLPAGPVQFTM